MNSQNSSENSSNAENTADNKTNNFDDIYSYSSKLPPQTEEGVASDGELGEVKYAERSINDDIDDYIFTKAHRSHSHHHHHHHHSNTENAEDTLLVQSSRPAKGNAHKCSTKAQATKNIYRNTMSL